MVSARQLVVVPMTTAVVAIFFLLLAGNHPPALAQGNACMEDVQKFCKDVPPGRGNVMKCLRAHQAELSPACQEQIQAAKAQAQEVSQACQSDVQQFCQGVKPGRGAIAKCLRAHESELSAACKDELAQVRSMRKAPR
ncbi:MAG TPA: cysteine rich repeat-containing protein [Alphaproteobacteria bacterium]|nr:cysteine rich repeat-containing protein [Alphaproteobacteria bacterium]